MSMSSKNLFLLLLLIIMPAVSFAETFQIDAENFEKKLNEAIESAPAGSTIVMPEGRFEMMSELALTTNGLILRGQGMSKTILTFKNQKVGAQGILGSAHGLVFEDFSVEDPWGDGIKVTHANGVTFRRVRVAWSKPAFEGNGAYGLYPVMSRNVLVEDCEVTGSSDAGVYVGQSENIIVRGTKAYGNVAGIEIENSRYADVYNNHAYNNTAGILIFNLPQLPKKGGKQTRVFNNKVENNNLKNFATDGSIVKLVPDGLGVFVMANSEVEIFKNEIIGNELTGVAVVHYAVTERSFDDAGYDPMPRHIYIHDNVLSEKKFKLPSFDKMSLIIKILLGFKTPEIMYDGIDDGTYNGKPLSDYDKICIQNNKLTDGRDASYGNLHLDNKRAWVPFPGGPATTDLAPHNCQFPAFPEIKLEAPTFPQNQMKAPSKEMVQLKCKAPSQGVNWDAIEYDCPALSDFNLFQDRSDAARNPNRGGFEYKLNNQLFTDYAEKDRFIFLPPGKKMEYRDRGVFEFPVGTVITKTFSYFLQGEPVGGRPTPIETRVLVKRKSGWQTLEYVWTPDKKDAVLSLGGEVRPLNVLVHGKDRMSLNYGIPNRRQCASCHASDDKFKGQLFPIGPKAKFLNWEVADGAGKTINQIKAMAENSQLGGLPADFASVPRAPAWDDEKSGPLDLRAKSYLEINCAHCHSPVGPAASTGLYLLSELDSRSADFGYCKRPVAAGMASGGRFFDVVPGNAERSILNFRMTHTHLAIRMPQLGRTVTHVEAMKMIGTWIEKMDGSCK